MYRPDGILTAVMGLGSGRHRDGRGELVACFEKRGDQAVTEYLILAFCHSVASDGSGTLPRMDRRLNLGMREINL